ncbi:MAG TPA: murein transglycosylase A [Rhizomicrobium sp.]|jgi:membrane-bound lytic murein transglycosylase A
MRLTRTGFSDLPGWRQGDMQAALASFRRSCAVLMAKPDTAAMGGAGYAGTVSDWRGVCTDAGGDPRNFFERNFTAYAVSAGEDGLFTGYYEPQISASRKRHGAFQTAVYGLPPDLVRADLGAFIPKLKGEHISGRMDGQRLVPYAARAEIDAHGIAAAPVLFYTDDAVAFFFLQIQGSGRVRFDDGSAVRIAYAGENGRPYTAIGRTLIAEGALTRETVSLQTIRAWLLANPKRARAVMEGNESYIFFKETPLGDKALGSAGSLGAALTPGASLAVDLRLHALGVPFYVDAGGDDPMQALMIAQDTGGAIRGAVRGDIFFGFGARAEARAGVMKAPGHLYLLLPNTLAAKVGADFTP